MAACVEMDQVTKTYQMGEVTIKAADGISFQVEGYSGSESGRTVNGNRKRDVWQGTVCSDRSGNLLCGINSDKETDGSI